MGGQTDGLLVRTEESLSSAVLGRLTTGSLVEELQRCGHRLHFKLLSGLGPQEGWISLQLQGKALAELSKCSPLRAALAGKSLGALEARERGLALWRWGKIEAALKELEAAPEALLALQLLD